VDAANIWDAAGPCTQPEKSSIDTGSAFMRQWFHATFEHLVESFPRFFPSKSLYCMCLYISHTNTQSPVENVYIL
jgi:hypothetical protein